MLVSIQTTNLLSEPPRLGTETKKGNAQDNTQLFTKDLTYMNVHLSKLHDAFV